MWVLNVTKNEMVFLFSVSGKMGPVCAKGVVLSESIFLVFRGCHYMSSNSSSTFGYSTNKRLECSNTMHFVYFLTFDKQLYEPVNATVTFIGRRYHTLVKRNEIGMIVFGGIIYGDGYRRDVVL